MPMMMSKHMFHHSMSHNTPSFLRLYIIIILILYIFYEKNKDYIIVRIITLILKFMHIILKIILSNYLHFRGEFTLYDNI